MKYFLLIVTLYSLCSCAKLGYLIDQGKGQWDLMSSGRPNGDVLSDPKVKIDIKDKIKLIEKYKRYFYGYFKRDATDIYSETVFLQRDAVTYLVIASPFDDIRAREECFIFMGCFPYLGFFDEKKANEYAQELEGDEFVTYVRPVRAYSTLGYLDDHILSTFFLYSEEGLAELIFHELFHTIFFIKNEVDLNENLANFFAKKMVVEYFSYSNEKIQTKQIEAQKQSLMNQFIVGQVEMLKKKYADNMPLTKEAAKQLFLDFMKGEFKPRALEVCKDLKVTYCYPLERKWNNASLTAFLTYEKRMKTIEELYMKSNKTLNEFLNDLEARYKSYRDKNKKENFSEILWSDRE
jgi:predicted aminopeptidase